MENEPAAPDTDRRMRLKRVANGLLLAFLVIVAAAGFGTAIWRSYFSPSDASKRLLSSNPLIVYADLVRQQIQKRMDAEYAKKRVPGPERSLKLRIRLKATGDLDSVEVERTSGSIEADDFAARIVRESAPFGALPVQLPKKTDVVTISTDFKLR